MDGLAELAETMERMKKAQEYGQLNGVRRAGRYAVKTIRASVRTAAGGDMRLSGVGAGGARLGVRTGRSKKGLSLQSRLAYGVTVYATGPIHLLDAPTGTKEVYPRRRKALRFNGLYAAHALAGPTRGKRSFQAGVARAAPALPGIIERETAKRVEREFRR